jgi:quercetin dioxygenase-like cupin family protein
VTPSRSRLRTHDVHDVIRGLSAMQMRAFGSFNRCTVGVLGFPAGPTRWERHPDDDELLYLLTGEMDLTILGDGAPTRVTLRAGSLFIMPRGVWHRPQGREAGTVLFATSRTEHSTADDPRRG